MRIYIVYIYVDTSIYIICISHITVIIPPWDTLPQLLRHIIGLALETAAKAIETTWNPLELQSHKSRHLDF